jgi:hypothetical protein
LSLGFCQGKRKAAPHPLTSASSLHNGYGKFKPTTTTTVRNENVSWSSQKLNSWFTKLFLGPLYGKVKLVLFVYGILNFTRF